MEPRDATMPNAELRGGADLRLDDPGPSRRKEIVVVEHRRAAGQHELREPGPGRGVLRLVVDPAPDGKERLQPCEEVGLLGPRAGERLEKVVMDVDEPGRDECSTQVGDTVGCRRLAVADSRDRGAVDEDPAVRELRAEVVHREDVRIRQ